MKDSRCGCCEGTDLLTPLPTANRPGLDALRYRVGTHPTFYETMVARLTTHHLDDDRRPLQFLTTRAPEDPALALLDAWATIADVLTFYQERIANEGYLLTATERRSVLELARLVGYRLRPGVAASVFLAFTLEKEYEIEVPVGTRAQSIPEPGELPQMFETDVALPARTLWNAIPARQTHPPMLQPDAAFDGARIFYVQGAVSGLKTNDTALFICGAVRQPYTIQAAEADPTNDRTLVTYTLYGSASPPPSSKGPDILTRRFRIEDGAQEPALTRLATVVSALRKNPSFQPASRFQLSRSPNRTYSASADLGPQLLTQFYPRLKNTLYAAYANAPVTGTTQPACQVEVFRVKTAPFGHNAPLEIIFDDGEVVDRREWRLAEFNSDLPTDQEFRTLSLDAVYAEIAPGGYVLIDRADRDQPIIAQIQQVRTISRAAYGIAARVTQLVLDRPWLSSEDTSLSIVRGTTVFAQSEQPPLAETPIEADVAADEIELDDLYDGLEAGRWLVVSGERTDILDAEGHVIAGVEASELVMLAGIVQDVHTVLDDNGNEMELPTDTLHTRLILAEPLAYTYKRDTVTINANVVRATHGETRNEILGSGNGAQAFQQFTLKQPPLTYLAAPTPEGVASTLEVRVNDIRWPAHKTLLYLDGNERGYETKTNDDGKTSVIFGDGTHSARLPSGVENVTAVYRNGIGKGGNVAAEQISMLATRPLGVKEVINPQRASGGADPESRDQARRNVPLAVLALDRLVSVEDYANFTRTFAGIGKAYATSLSDGRREVVHLTIAGTDDIPIDAQSDLHRNLLLALSRFGDPNVPLQVALREAVFIFISTRVKVLDDYLWEHIEPLIRTALLDTLSFDRRTLGQDVLLSEIISAIQGIEGVDYVDVDLLDGVSEGDALDPESLANKLATLATSSDTSSSTDCTADVQPRQRLTIKPARIDPLVADPALRIRPAQIAYLNHELPDTLILTEVTS